jgi:protein arginine kinase activator
MKCDRCDGEATVHEVVIRSGTRAERHLCERCAAKLGLFGDAAGPVLDPSETPAQPGPAGHAFSFSPVAKLPLAGSLADPSAGSGTTSVGKPGTGEAAKVTACRGCGMTLAQFRKDERLGCPRCYEDLGAALAALIERVHEGACSHVGKVPRRQASRPGPALPAPPASAHAVGPLDSAATAQHGKAPSDASAQRRRLRERLAQAVALEQFELAAKLRDELAQLDKRLATGLVQPGEDPR